MKDDEEDIDFDEFLENQATFYYQCHKCGKEFIDDNEPILDCPECDKILQFKGRIET